MPFFKYSALDSESKKVEGLIDAFNENEAAEILREKGLNILSVSEQKKGYSLDDLMAFLNKISQKDIVIFSRQISVLISANVSLVESLRIISSDTKNPKFKSVLSQIAEEINGGARFSDALERWPNVFSGFYINVIRSGETSGKLDEVLEYLADEMEKDYDLNNKIKGAMIYPAVVLSALLITGVIMMIFVVPKLTEVIEEGGVELPLATRMLMGLSGFFVSYWFFILLFLIGLPIFYRMYTKTVLGKQQADKMKLRLPVFGKLLQRIYVVRFARSMNTLIMGGVSISKSLEVVADIVDNKVYKDLIVETSVAVEEGNSISSVFMNSKEIPVMVSQMMSVGERTGKMGLVLGKISNFYTREINNIVANLTALLEPIVIIILGVAVGFMVGAIILPMYNMANMA